MKTSIFYLMQFDRGGRQRDEEVTWSKQWARKSDSYGNTLKGYEQGKVAFVKAEAKDALLIMMQHGNNFNWKRQGCIFGT